MQKVLVWKEKQTSKGRTEEAWKQWKAMASITDKGKWMLEDHISVRY